MHHPAAFRCPRLVLVWGIAALAALPAAATDPFYLDLLREGGLAYDRGEAGRAVRDLKLACFGLLDEPKLIGECLARLTLAEDKSGDAEGFRDTFRRLCEVEERFDGYSQAAPGLPPALRAQLEKRLVAALPAGTLEQSPPAFRNLAPGKAAETHAANAPARRPKPKTEAPPSATVSTPPPAPAGRTLPAAPSTSTPAPPPTSVAAPGPAVPRTGAAASGETAAPGPAASAKRLPPAQGLSADDRAKLGQVRRTLDQEGEIRGLSQAFDLARGVADVHPESAEAQHLAGEAAYRIKRFKEAAEYLRRGGDPGDAEPELLFYQAVALFELGSKDEAAAIFKRALPNLRRTPYVDGYAKKILGQ